jgi:hypothetical protein
MLVFGTEAVRRQAGEVYVLRTLGVGRANSKLTFILTHRIP